MASDILGTTTPASLEAEEALLGAVLLDYEEALPNALETNLRPDDFYQEIHAEIFQAFRNLEASHQPVDQITVAEELKKRGSLEKCGGSAYLARLYDGPGLAANAGRYARIIIDRAILRRLITLSGSIIERCQGSPPDVKDLLDQVEKEILEVRSERRADSFINAAENLQGIFAEIIYLKDKRREGLELTGVPTGYDALDKLTGGFQPSDLIILAARTSQGKTSLALNWALNAAVPELRQTHRQLPAKTVAFFSLEMDQRQLLFRLISQVGLFNLKDLRTGWTSDDDVIPLTDTINRLGEAQIYIDDTATLRVLELRAKARRLQNQLQHKGSNLDLIVVDYLQLMRGSEQRRASDNREQEVSEISRSLKSLAKELRLPVIALAQLNRDADKRSGRDKRPKLSDLRESGAIEQDADLIAVIHSPETRGENGPEGGGGHEESHPGGDRQVELLILKHRNGPLGDIPLYFKASSTTFQPSE